MATASSQSAYNEVQAIFIELFDRPAATAGYNYFGSQLATDSTTPTAVFNQISGSSEVTSSITVNSLFENLLGRAAGAPALAFFGGELKAGQSIANIANQIYNDVLNESHTSQDYMVMTDKIDYANNYTGYLATNPSFTYNTANAQAYVNQVTPAGVMTGAVTSATMPAVTSFVAGTTVDLVTTQTSYIEPASNGIVDFVYGATSSSAQSQINGVGGAAKSLADDTLQAGAGGATLTINDTNTTLTYGIKVGGNLPTTMSGVSTIVVNGDAAGTSSSAADQINISSLSGVTDLKINQTLEGKTLTSYDVYTVSPTQTLTLENVTSGNVDVNSTGTSANVSLDNVALTDLNVNQSSKSAIATLNLTNLSGTNSFTLADLATSATLSAITVASTDTSSSASTTITGATNIDSVNASADQGTLTYIMPTSITNSSKAFTFTGGTGTDTVSLVSAPSSSITYAFDGNSAGTNTLEINYSSPAAADLKTYTNDASNFHTLLFGGSVTTMPTIDMANINSAFTNVTFSSGASTIDVKDALGTGSTGTSGDVFNINQAIGTSLTVSDASGNNAVNFTMGGGFTVAAIDTFLSPLAGVAPQSDINITSNSSIATSTNIINALNVADGATVNLYGSEALTITSLNDATTSPTPSAGLTVNAGSMTGALTLSLSNGTATSLNDNVTVGNASGNSITLNAAGLGHDTVTVGTGTNTINAEATTYTLAASASAVTSTTPLTGYTAITDNNYTVTTGSHEGLTNLTLDLALATGGTASTPATISEASSAALAKIAAGATQAQAVYDIVNYMTTNDTTTGNYVNWFQYDGDTYIVGYSYYSTTPTHADSVVQLVGTASILANDLANHPPVVNVG